MSKNSFDRVLVPAAVCAVSFAGFAYYAEIAPALNLYAPWLPSPEIARTGLGVVGVLALAWLLSRLAEVVITRSMALKGRRPPQLLHEVIAVALLLAAAAFAFSLLVDTSLAGLLATSGMVVAMLGFALRKAIADVFSGIALGLERPFQIGDWVDTDSGVAGRVVQMNWRSTRIETRNKVHVFVPNSRLAGGRLTNYSAPQRHYRTQVRIILDAAVSTQRAKQLLLGAALRAPLIRHSPAPDIRVDGFVEDGIAYRVRFWIDDHASEIDSHDSVLSSIDRHLRLAGVETPAMQRRACCLRAGPREQSPIAQIERILAEVRPFRYLDAERLSRLAAGTVRLSVPAGSSVAAACVGSDSLLVLIEGALRVSSAAADDPGASIMPGELLGLAAGESRTAEKADLTQIVAACDSVLLALPREEIAAIRLLDPAFGDALDRTGSAPTKLPKERQQAAPSASRHQPRPRFDLPQTVNRLRRAAFRWSSPGHPVAGPTEMSRAGP